MSIHIQQVNPQGMRAYMGTLTDGIELHTAFTNIARSLDIACATFALLGGLTSVTFSAYDFLQQKRRDPITLQGALEIVGGHGTISLHEGQPHVHLHLALSYYDGDSPQVIAGHVSNGVVFAVEFTLLTYDGAPIHRHLHLGTGLQLWHLPPLS